MPSGSCRSNICRRATPAKALESGDKALELFPNDLDILVSQICVAQAMKDSGKVVDYAVRGGAILIPSRSSRNPPMSQMRIGSRAWPRSRTQHAPATTTLKLPPTTPSPASRILASA